MSRQDQHLTTVAVDGTDLGVFDTFSGGNVDSEETKYRAGGLQPEVALGGSVTVENVTVGRLYQLDRDHNISHWLMSRAGKGRVTITRQPLDVDGNVFGRPHVYTGILKAVTTPDQDSNSSDPSVLELEVSTNGTVG